MEWAYRPANINKDNQLDNTELDSLNSPRTPSLDNGYDFDRHVAATRSTAFYFNFSAHYFWIIIYI